MCAYDEALDIHLHMRNAREKFAKLLEHFIGVLYIEVNNFPGVTIVFVI